MSLKSLPKTRFGKQFARLNQISYPENKTAAVRFPQEVQTMDLIFKKKNSGGHMGLRKFWHSYLPVIKFYNEALNINVQRISLSEGVTDKAKIKELENNPTLINKCPSKIVLHYNNGKTTELECKNKFSDEILTDLIAAAKAQPVPESDLVKFKNNIY